MPNNDRTGPEGKGPRTGRGKGLCKPKEDETTIQERPRRGLRNGFGLRGPRRG